MSGLGIQGELINEENAPKIAVIGCGSHSFRNIFPTFQYLNIELVATCDLIEEKAQRYARQFGAQKFYTDYRIMLQNETLDGVIMVLGYGSKGEPLYPEIVNDVLKKGVSVWIEKPPAANSMLIEEFIESESFGKPTSYYMKYNVDLPHDSSDLRLPSSRRFIDDYVHVASMQQFLFGPASKVIYFNNSDESGFANFFYESGLIGTVHFSRSSSKLSPIERIEVIGEGENVIMDNNIDIRYYSKGNIGPYGSTPSYIPKSGSVKIFSPEFSLGQLYNKGLFLLGYYNEMKYFVDNLRLKMKPKKAGSEDALAVMKYIDSFTAGSGKMNDFGHYHVNSNRINVNKEVLKCENCGENSMYLKDGWNYTCVICGNTISAD